MGYTVSPEYCVHQYSEEAYHQSINTFDLKKRAWLTLNQCGTYCSTMWVLYCMVKYSPHSQKFPTYIDKCSILDSGGPDGRGQESNIISTFHSHRSLSLGTGRERWAWLKCSYSRGVILGQSLSWGQKQQWINKLKASWVRVLQEIPGAQDKVEMQPETPQCRSLVQLGLTCSWPTCR